MTRNSWWACFSVAAIALTGCQRPLAHRVHVSQDTVERASKVIGAGGESAGGEAVVLADPTGWATLAGKITLDGPAPQRSPLTVDKDVDTCAPGGKQVLDELVVVGPDGGLKNVLIVLSTSVPLDNPAWVHESYQEISTGERIFDQKNCVFLNHVAAMQYTQRLKILNSDNVGHNTNLDSKRGAMAFNRTIAAGGSETYEPGAPSPAPFPVSCAIHPWMKAWMMVCESPYFAVTTEDGAFEIPNLPAGVELEFRVWQEKGGYLEAVTVNGQSDKWSKGKFKLTLAPDERHEMNVAVGASVFH